MTLINTIYYTESFKPPSKSIISPPIERNWPKLEQLTNFIRWVNIVGL